MIGDPYDRTKVPASPRGPVTFSPLRPVRDAMRYMRCALWVALDNHPPLIAVLFFGAMFVVLVGVCGGAIADVSSDRVTGPEMCVPIGGYAALAIAAWWAPVAWLRSAMHLDNAEAREVWERRLTR